MPPGSFQTNSFGWRLQLLTHQVEEWVELQLANLSLPNVPDVPNWSLPDWLTQGIFWLVVSLLAAWLIWQLVPLLASSFGSARSTAATAKSVTKKPDRELTASGWWQRAQRFQQQGNYLEACRSLYLGMMQRLHDTKQVPHQRSRTDGEYLQATQPLTHAQAYQVLIQTHEQLCFGDVPASADLFERCQQAYREIESR